MGDATAGLVRLSFNPQLRVEFHGATVTSDAGRLLPRELDERLGLSALIERHLTDPPAKILRGYLAVDQRSGITTPEDLGAGRRICATKDGATFLRSFPPLAKYTPVILPPPELYEALYKGICSAIFFSEREQADMLLPVNVTSLRLIPVYQ